MTILQLIPVLPYFDFTLDFSTSRSCVHMNSTHAEKPTNNSYKEPHAVKDHTSTETHQEARAQSKVAVPSQRQAGNFSQTKRAQLSTPRRRKSCTVCTVRSRMFFHTRLADSYRDPANPHFSTVQRELVDFRQMHSPSCVSQQTYEVARDAVLRVYH